MEVGNSLASLSLSKEKRKAMSLQQRQSWGDQDGNVPVAWSMGFQVHMREWWVKKERDPPHTLCSPRGSLSSLFPGASSWMLGSCVQIFPSDTHVQQVGSTEMPIGDSRGVPSTPWARALLQWILHLPAIIAVTLTSERCFYVPMVCIFPGTTIGP